MIRLMITSDDCGMSEGINYVTADYHLHGKINVASIVTNYPQTTAHAFDVFQRCPNLELGVHLNLSDGKPLTTQMRDFDLMRGSERRILDKLLWVSRTLVADKKQLAIVEAELRAQIEAFLQFDEHPIHLTTHGHFHLLPAMRQIVYALADEYDIHWVRSTDFRQSIVPLNPMTQFDASGDDVPDSIHIPDYLLPIYAWINATPQQMLDDLLKADGLVEVIVHASLPVDVTFPKTAGYKPPERVREIRFLDSFYTLLEPHIGTTVQLFNHR